jgi:cytochrome bd-type quinol oxidase subunit 2
MNLLSAFISDRFWNLDSFADNQMKWDIPNYTMNSVRKWANLVTSFLTVGFLWWRYDSENTDADETVSSGESRSYYGGILFAITVGYILSLVRVLGGGYWQFADHPILVEVITCLLIVLITIGAIFMLVKRRTTVLSITMIFILIVIHFFSSHYLPSIISNHLTPNDTLYGKVNIFPYVATVCDIAFNLAAFILYRREMKQQNV